MKSSKDELSVFSLVVALLSLVSISSISSTTSSFGNSSLAELSFITGGDNSKSGGISSAFCLSDV